MIQVKLIGNIKEAEKELEAVGVGERGIELMAPKAVCRVLKVYSVDVRAACIIKQEMLSVGGEAAVSWGSLERDATETDVLLMGSLKQYRRLINKLEEQPFGLRELACELNEVLSRIGSVPAPIRVDEKLFDWRRTYVMGVINNTPDSFSGDGLGGDLDAVAGRARLMAESGVDVFDVGGESTRPGAQPVSVDEEQKRVLPVVELLLEKYSIPVCVDTYKLKVAKAALKAGVHMINDINGLRTKGMANLLAEYNVPVVLMHMQGTPENMQVNPSYDSVVDELYRFFADRVEYALDAGIKKENIILDPGIGFGKTLEHNLTLLRHLGEFKSLGLPLLVGASRKSFIGLLLDLPASKRLEGSLAAACTAIMHGANIIRVHDVKESIRAARVADSLRQILPA